MSRTAACAARLWHIRRGLRPLPRDRGKRRARAGPAVRTRPRR